MTSARKEYLRRTRQRRMRELVVSKAGVTGAVCAIIAFGLFVASVIISTIAGGDGGYIVGSMGLAGLVCAVGALLMGIAGIREPKARPTAPRIAAAVGAVMTIVLALLYVSGAL